MTTVWSNSVGSANLPFACLWARGGKVMIVAVKLHNPIRLAALWSKGKKLRGGFASSEA